MQWLFDFEFVDHDVPEKVKFQYTRTPRAEEYRTDLQEINDKVWRMSKEGLVKSMTYYPSEHGTVTNKVSA